MVAQGVNPAEVYVDVWAGGDMPPNNDPNHLHAGHRILRGLAFLRGPSGAPNPYVRPIEGVVTAVCMDHHVLAAIEVSDEVRNGTIYPVNQETGGAATVRARLPALTTTGQGYTLNGNLLTWDKWRLRIGFTFREGLVLH